MTYGKAITLAKEIREYSKAPIVIGGVHISTLPGSFNKAFDFGIMGEGEITFTEVVSAFADNEVLDHKTLAGIDGIIDIDNGEIKQTAPRKFISNPDDIPFPDMKYINPIYFRPRDEVGLGMIEITGWIMTARGCPYQCSFCAQSAFWKNYRTHSPAYVADNISYLIENYNVKLIDITDGLFTVNKGSWNCMTC